MSDPANNGQGNTDTGNAAANVAVDDTATQATGTTDTQTTGETGTGQTATDTPNTDGKPAGEEGDKGGEAKPGETGKDDENKDGKDDKAQAKAPESYEFQAPEGVTLDAQLLEEFSGIAKELDLSQEDAQKVVDLGPKLMQKFADHQVETISQVQAKWIADTKADPEIGGEDVNKKLADSKAALEAFGTPELKTLLVDSGLGNNPEVIRVFYRIGQAIKNDGLVNGRQQHEGGKDLASRLYPNHKP